MANFKRYTMTFVTKGGGKQVPCTRCNRCKKVGKYSPRAISAFEYLDIWEEEHLKWCNK